MVIEEKKDIMTNIDELCGAEGKLSAISFEVLSLNNLDQFLMIKPVKYSVLTMELENL